MILASHRSSIFVIISIILCFEQALQQIFAPTAWNNIQQINKWYDLSVNMYLNLINLHHSDIMVSEIPFCELWSKLYWSSQPLKTTKILEDCLVIYLLTKTLPGLIQNKQISYPDKSKVLCLILEKWVINETWLSSPQKSLSLSTIWGDQFSLNPNTQKGIFKTIKKTTLYIHRNSIITPG